MRNFFSRFFRKSNREDISPPSFEEDINVLETEEEYELLGIHESALREDPKFQRLGEGKKRRRLLKEAIAKDYEEQHRRSPDQLWRIAEYEKSKETFVIPNGMTAEEATREMIKKESEIYGEGGSAKRIVRDLSYPIGRNTGDPFDNMSDYQRSSYLQSLNTLHTGKRGGKYYLVKSKVSGRVYRQYTN